MRAERHFRQWGSGRLAWAQRQIVNIAATARAGSPNTFVWMT
jgi:hypothetical protein